MSLSRALNPNNGQALLEISKMLIERGDIAGALARLKKAAEVMPSAPPVHYQSASSTAGWDRMTKRAAFPSVPPTTSRIVANPNSSE